MHVSFSDFFTLNGDCGRSKWRRGEVKRSRIYSFWMNLCTIGRSVRLIISKGTLGLVKVVAWMHGMPIFSMNFLSFWDNGIWFSKWMELGRRKSIVVSTKFLCEAMIRFRRSGVMEGVGRRGRIMQRRSRYLYLWYLSSVCLEGFRVRWNQKWNNGHQGPKSENS